jgi:hypothetical protein
MQSFVVRPRLGIRRQILGIPGKLEEERILGKVAAVAAVHSGNRRGARLRLA